MSLFPFVILAIYEKISLAPFLFLRRTDRSSLTGGTAACTETADSLEITLNGNRDVIDTIVALALASTAAKIKPVATLVTGKNDYGVQQTA